jgi:cytochrome c-type biogenesis protein CcsB
MGFLLILFAASIGYATFIENDFDAITARLLVYNARWFEVLIFLMVVNFSGMIFTKRLYKRNKLNILLIHLALIIIIIGAAVTRYFGFEGEMHIRNGQTSYTFLTADTYLGIDAEYEGNFRTVKEKLLISAHKTNLLRKKISIGERELDLAFSQFIPYATKRIEAVAEGSPYIHVIVGGADGRHDIVLKEGESTNLHGFGISFGDTTLTKYVQILRKGDSLLFKTPFDLVQNLDESTMTVSESTWRPLNIMDLQSFRNIQFLVKDFQANATVAYTPVDEGQGHSIPVAMYSINGKQVFGELERLTQVTVDGINLSIYLGRQEVTLPFALKLNKFKLDRYPGSNSPSSFTSDIVLLDKDNGVEEPYQIFMNNVLEYRGYRFYQSSYDQDEKGTILSVNNDYWGTRVTYIGYFLLFVSLIFSFFTKHTRFRRTLDFIQETHDKRKKLTASVILLLMVSVAHSQPVDKVHADAFGSLVLQGQDGRMMPLNTLAQQLLIKIHKDDEYYGMTPEQVILDISMNPMAWQTKPFVRVNHVEVEYLLEITGKYASYADFFDQKGQYRLSGAAKRSYEKKPALRDQFDKELIKVSERINLYHSLLRGTMLNILPVPDDPNQVWTSPGMFAEIAVEETTMPGAIFEDYIKELKQASKTNDYTAATLALEKIRDYQKEEGREIIPSEKKINFEIFYNKANIFKRLFPVYFTLGILLVALFFLETLKPSLNFHKLSKGLFGILVLGFGLHTIGLIIRWYISGHAPWSNGYESMIYISWATVLAGFLFMKKSSITLGLTATLAGITLLTAHMSWMDPEITNLVPVLKSYWLTIHVAAITASYGFLGLACIMGFFNLTLMPFRNAGNLERLNLMLKELTLIIELSLICGLVLLIIGNFLGAIWANESWGRYWGWDPKETWTLVTIIWYSFVLHMNLIPGLRNAFTFNFFSLIGFSAVLMTYFGVNFYLSGLHSYASGDPVPVPSFVYYTLLIIAIISALALYNEIMVKGKLKRGSAQ